MLKTVIQGNVAHRELDLTFHSEEVYCIPGQINPETEG